ncbi:hypothetical protein AMK59_4577 [Oryctes borbonicus]|uniref:SAYSvFN domain-containing protein n=1 Tax=Oryctes borbonicus TaxID=1629725 RepID=A0A0T6B6H3_9SCAR|nr:hypothetical protein AMK59_4577 [Oryctes borbonicus]
MEEKLAKYRAEKEREAFINQSKERPKKIFSLPIQRNKQTIDREIVIDATPEEQEKLINNSTNEDVRSIASEAEDISCCSLLDIVTYALWFIIWASLYAVFIKLQFGTVYLIVSGIIFICLNTRTKPKKPNEISAYSVFNKDCKSIDGTLKAEQLERQMIFGRGVFHV